MKWLYIAAAAAVALPPYAVWSIYKYVFARKRPPLLNAVLDKKTHVPEYYVWRDARAEALGQMQHITHTMLSDRGEELKGFYFPCGEAPCKRIAFIVHGYHSEHLETAGMLYDFYHSRGFDVFAPDNTASGHSGGNWFGYDVFESADCLKWLEYLRSEYGRDIQVIMHGFSLGGATVMKMSDRVPDIVKFTVEDSGFTDARGILRPQLGPLYGIIGRINARCAGYELKETDVSPALRRTKQPMLFVHGKDDPTVPFSNAPKAYEMHGGEKDFLFTDSARHIETMFVSSDDYAKKLDEFIARYIK